MQHCNSAVQKLQSKSLNGLPMVDGQVLALGGPYIMWSQKTTKHKYYWDIDTFHPEHSFHMTKLFHMYMEFHDKRKRPLDWMF